MVDTDLYWRTQLNRPEHRNRPEFHVRTVLGPAEVGQSHTVQVLAINGIRYALKPIRPSDTGSTRRMIADALTGQIGILIGAPVAVPAFLRVTRDLIDASPEWLDGCLPGLCHGTEWIDHVQWAKAIQFATQGDNASRFVLLAVLYGLIGADDRQFLYDRSVPRLVHSHDHGNFLPIKDLQFTSSPLPLQATWTPESLRQRADAGPEPDPVIVRGAQCAPAAIRSAVELLSAYVDDKAIARAVASIPSEWGISESERIALCSYLKDNRVSMLEAARRGRLA